MPEFAATIHALCRDHSHLTLRQIDLAILAYRRRESPAGRGTKDFSAEMNISKPAVTRAMDRLETDGYGTRIRNTDDKRLVTFTLSEKGRKFAAALLGHIESPEGGKRAGRSR